jgi:hypothetical protein
MHAAVNFLISRLFDGDPLRGDDDGRTKLMDSRRRHRLRITWARGDGLERVIGYLHEENAHVRITYLPRYVDRRQIRAIQIKTAQPRDVPSRFGCFNLGLSAQGQRQSHASRRHHPPCHSTGKVGAPRSKKVAAEFPREPF